VEQQNKDVDEIFRLVTEFFKGDNDKAYVWLYTANPNLGNISPFDMMAMGRVEKLKKFVITSLEENSV